MNDDQFRSIYPFRYIPEERRCASPTCRKRLANLNKGDLCFACKALKNKKTFAPTLEELRKEERHRVYQRNLARERARVKQQNGGV